MKCFLFALAFLFPNPVLAGHELENRDLRKGEALYKEHCASCHGAKLEGQPNWRQIGKDGLLPAPPHDRTGHTWASRQHAPVRLHEVGRKGPDGGAGHQRAQERHAGFRGRSDRRRNMGHTSLHPLDMAATHQEDTGQPEPSS